MLQGSVTTYERAEVFVPQTQEVFTEAITEPLEDMIRDTFPEQPDLMVKIANAESDLIVDAYNPEWHYDRHGNKVCQGSRGIFQIACVNYEGNQDDLFDPEVNLKLARQVYDSQNLFAWGVCHNGAVDCGTLD